MEKKTEKKTKTGGSGAGIVKAVLLVLGILFLLAGVFSDQIFGENSTAAKVMKENVGDIVNVFSDIGNNGVVILRSVTYIIVVLIIAYLLRLLLHICLAHTKRGKTVLNMFGSIIKYVSGIIIVFLVLAAFGVDTTTLLASAGILALVISLGAQSLVADILAGFFIIFESDYKIDDVVVIDGFRGKILEIGIRNTKLLDAAGNIQIVNNSSIGKVINMSGDLSLAVCEVSIEYGESIERVENVISNSMDTIRTRIPAIVEGPYYKGVTSLADSGVILKFIAKVNEEDRFQTERDLNREIKIIFDKNGINIPFPQVVVNQPNDFKKVSEATRERANDFVDEQKELSKNIDENQPK